MNAAYRLAYFLLPLALVVVVGVWLHHSFDQAFTGIVVGGER